MAILLVDGFDMYNGIGSNTGVYAKWSPINGNGSLIAGVFGGQAFRTPNGGSQTLIRSFTAAGSFSAGFAFRCSSLGGLLASSNIRHHVAMYSGTTVMVGFQFQIDGSITVYRYSGFQAGTALGSTAAGVITNNSFQFIEFSGTISSTVGTITLKVSGVTVLTLTGQNTQNGAPTTVDTIYFGTSSNSGFNTGGSANHDFDDVYILDSATSLGERRVETLRPATDSVVTWTPSSGVNNFSRVNETLVDGDTSYVQSATVGNLDLYTIGSLSSTPTTIDAVQVSSFAEKTDATTRSIFNSIKSGATSSDGAGLTLAASYGRFDRLVLTDPATSAAWTASGVNALLIGPKVAT